MLLKSIFSHGTPFLARWCIRQQVNFRFLVLPGFDVGWRTTSYNMFSLEYRDYPDGSIP